MPQEYLELDVKGRKYRVGQLLAHIGAALVRKITGAAAGDPSRALAMMLGGMPFADELLIQKHLLSVIQHQVQVEDHVNWMPTFNGDRCMDPHLTHDMLSVWALQQASFDHNLRSFFIPTGQKEVTAILAQVPTPTPSSSETSTDSSSVQ